MAESIIVHFARADRATVAYLLKQSACSSRGDHGWEYPSGGAPTLLIGYYSDIGTEYDQADLHRLAASLGGAPVSSIAIELRRSAGSRAIDDAIGLSASLLSHAEGVVDDTYSEIWTLDDIQHGVRKHDGGFLDCYRNQNV